MNYGLQLSASGVLTSMYRQDVLANNLANVDTVGFKPDNVAFRQRSAARIEDGLFNLPSNSLLERLGAGVLVAPNRASMTQGAIDKSANELDAAINGPGFFVVAAGDGRGADTLRLTRDGRFTLGPGGRLQMATTGHAILDAGNRPITLDRAAGPIGINADGSITQHGSTVARINLVDVPDAGALRKEGASLFKIPPGQLAGLRPATGQIQPGAIERSAVDPIQAIMGVTDAASSVAANARMIQLQDDLMNRAINTLGRVA
jgi:flagellar basal-body rod protein FlgF